MGQASDKNGRQLHKEGLYRREPFPVGKKIDYDGDRDMSAYGVAHQARHIVLQAASSQKRAIMTLPRRPPATSSIRLQGAGFRDKPDQRSVARNRPGRVFRGARDDFAQGASSLRISSLTPHPNNAPASFMGARCRSRRCWQFIGAVDYPDPADRMSNTISDLIGDRGQSYAVGPGWIRCGSSCAVEKIKHHPQAAA